MAEQLLRNPGKAPTSEVIAECLGAANVTYIQFFEGLQSHNIDVEYRYYTDSNAWLGKGLYRWIGARGGQKEVTAFWLSIWDDPDKDGGFFKVTMYIPEKSRAEALALPLTGEVKNRIEKAKQLGKLKFFPLVFDLDSEELLDEIYTLIDFRKKIK